MKKIFLALILTVCYASTAHAYSVSPTEYTDISQVFSLDSEGVLGVNIFRSQDCVPEDGSCNIGGFGDSDPSDIPATFTWANLTDPPPVSFFIQFFSTYNGDPECPIYGDPILNRDQPCYLGEQAVAYIGLPPPGPPAPPIGPIYAFSALLISMLTFTVYIGVMFLICIAVGYPLAIFMNRIFRMLKGPQHFND